MNNFPSEFQVSTVLSSHLVSDILEMQFNQYHKTTMQQKQSYNVVHMAQFCGTSPISLSHLVNIIKFICKILWKKEE
jgi:hypothetical protein